MSKEYWEFTGEVKVENGVELKQIRAVCSFGIVVEGEVGGWIGDAVNLAQNGVAWLGEAVTAFGGTIRGGTIEGGTIWGGTIRGGTIEGGTIWGGTIWGGTIWGGTIRGGTIRGGTIEGGTIEGGTIWGGTIWGGTIWGGTIRGGDFLAISPIGSEDGQFTAEITESGEIICNRGCFNGSLDEFEHAVNARHGSNDYAAEYDLVVKIVRQRLGPIAEKRKAEKLADASSSQSINQG